MSAAYKLPNRQRRIIQITNSLNTSDGGPAANAYDLHRSFLKIPNTSGIIVALRSTLTELVDGRIGNHKGVTAAQSPAALTRIGWGRLMRLILQADFVILHGYYLPWTLPIAALAKASRSKVALTPHGSLTSYQQRSSRSRKAVYEVVAGHWVRRMVNVFILGSSQEADQLVRKFPLVECAVGGVGSVLPSEPPKRSTINGPTISLLSISRITEKKRIDLMIDAVAALRRGFTDARLVIAGEGSPLLTTALKQYAEASFVSDRVEFIGHADAALKRELYTKGNVFLAPSDDENFGKSVADALAWGLPVVASKYVASAEGLQPPAGIVIADQDGECIARAVIELVSLGTKLTSEASRHWAEQNFDWERVATNWVKILDGL